MAMIVDAGMATVAVVGMITGVVATMTAIADAAITGAVTAGNYPQKSGALSAAFFVPGFQ
jgi:hypothetical protein